MSLKMLQQPFRPFIIRLVAVSMILLVSSHISIASTDQVKVTLPSYTIEVNQVTLPNAYRNYPVIMYEHTPYYPLTYSDCRHLGLEMSKNPNTGLHLYKSNVSALLKSPLRKTKNPRQDVATIAPYPLKINETSLSKEERQLAPFLIYRNVPYMPLNNTITLQKLGITCQLKSSNILQINSGNPIPKTVQVPGYRQGDLLISQGYSYYFDEKNILIRYKLSNPTPTKALHKLPTDDLYVGKVKGHLFSDKGHAMLKYHVGGGFMGSDFCYLIEENGSLRPAQVILGDLALMTNTGVPPGGANLSVQHKGGAFKPLGDPKYIYGWSWLSNEKVESGSPTSDIYCYGNSLYLLATDLTIKPNYSRISKVDLTSGQVSSLSDLQVNHFVMENTTLYTVIGHVLHKIDAVTGFSDQETLDQELETFEVLGQVVYGVTSKTNYLYKIDASGSKPINEGAKVIELKLCNGYILCTFEETPQNPYRLMVIDSSGRINYKTSDVANSGTLSVDQGVLYYVESKSHQLCKIKLLALEK